VNVVLKRIRLWGIVTGIVALLVVVKLTMHDGSAAGPRLGRSGAGVAFFAGPAEDFASGDAGATGVRAAARARFTRSSNWVAPSRIWLTCCRNASFSSQPSAFACTRPSNDPSCSASAITIGSTPSFVT